MPTHFSCPHRTLCGGCRLSGMSYEEELAEKQKSIEALFSHPVSPIIPSPKTTAYRNKMEFSFGGNLTEKKLGLIERSKRGWVENISACQAISPWFNAVLNEVRLFFEQQPSLTAYFARLNRGHLRSLIMREGIRTGQKMVCLLVSGHEAYPVSEDALKAFVEAVLRGSAVDSILLRKQILVPGEPTRYEERVLFGEDHIIEQLMGDGGRSYQFKIKASTFFQPNPLLAEKLFAKAREELEDEPLLLDLYCGVGTFALLSSHLAKRTIGVELSCEAISIARENVGLNQLSSLEFFALDVSKMGGEYRPSAIVVDPPRSGLGDKAIECVNHFSPKKILYISCNPSTQAEEVKKFLALGYEIRLVQPADQFPHTPHLENLVVLRRSC